MPKTLPAIANAAALATADGRRWWLGDTIGETFEEGENHRGLALTIEVRDRDEAKAITRAILQDVEARE